MFQWDHIEKIPSHIAGRLHVAENAVAGFVGEFSGQNCPLHLSGDIKFVLQRNQLITRSECFTPPRHVFQGPVNGNSEVVEVDRFGDEVESATVHSRANVLHVTVCGNNHGANVRIQLRNLVKQGQPVHLRHIDIRDHHIDILLLTQSLQCFYTVACKDKNIFTGPDAPSHALQHERLQVRFVVHDENLVRICAHHQIFSSFPGLNGAMKPISINYPSAAIASFWDA